MGRGRRGRHPRHDASRPPRPSRSARGAAGPRRRRPPPGPRTGVRLTAHGGDASDLPTEVLQDFLDAVAAGEAHVPIDTVHALDDIARAHADMEAGRATGKLVVELD